MVICHPYKSAVCHKA